MAGGGPRIAIVTAVEVKEVHSAAAVAFRRCRPISAGVTDTDESAAIHGAANTRSRVPDG